MWRKEIFGDAELILGDCREILPTLGRFDAVVTDPPYGIGAGRCGHMHGGTPSPKWRGAVRVEYGAQEWDNSTSQEAIDIALSHSEIAIIFGGNYYKLPPTSCWLVWDKETNGTLADCELAWTNMQKAVRRIRFLWNGFARENNEPRGDHPTQKPEGVMRWCISQLPADTMTILDPFMGSGTTGVACVNLGRRFTGIEIEEKYFSIACRRIERAVAQPRLFEEPVQKPKQESML